VDGLKAQLCKSVEEVASEKERHKKSKTKFSKSFSEAKATQDNLREQIASLTNARTKDGDTTASLSGKIIQLNGTIKELRGKLMLSEDSVAAVEADLQTEKHRASLVRNELSELQVSLTTRNLLLFPRLQVHRHRRHHNLLTYL
jgi:chromosome segregation ATPase